MKLIKALIAGFAGAVALNILHETVRQLDPEAPGIHLLGEEALQKSLPFLGIEAPSGNNLYLATLAGDLLSNGLYYMPIALGKPKYLWFRAALAGTAAGIGALELPGPLGLDEKPVNRTNKTKLLMVTWYVFGALVTAAVANGMQKKSRF